MADSLKSRKLAEAKKSIERRSAQKAAREKAEVRRAEEQRLEHEKLKVDQMNSNGSAGGNSRTDEAIAELNKLLNEEKARERARKKAEESAEELRQKGRETRARAAERRKAIREAREKAVSLEGQKVEAQSPKEDMEILEVATPEEKLRRIRMQQTQVIPNLATILEGVEDLTEERKEELQKEESQTGESSSDHTDASGNGNALYDSDEARLRRIRMQETRTLPNWDDIMGDMEDFDEEEKAFGELENPVEEEPETAADGVRTAWMEATAEKLEYEMPENEKPEDELIGETSGQKEKFEEEKLENEKTQKEKIEIEKRQTEELEAEETQKEIKEESKEEIKDEKPEGEKENSSRTTTDSLLDDLAAAAAELDSVGGILASFDTPAPKPAVVPADADGQAEKESPAAEPEEREWRKKRKKEHRVFRRVCWIVALVLLGVYAAGVYYFQNHFFPNTMMADISIACMDEQHLRTYFQQKVDAYKLQILQKDGSVDELSGSDIDLKEEWDETIFRSLEEQRGFAWPIKLIQGDRLPAAVNITYDQDRFTEALNALDCMSEEKQVMPEDARLSNYTIETGYQVLPPMDGTAIDKELVTSAVENAVKTLGQSLNLQEMNAYYTKEYVADMDQLKVKAAALNDHSHAVINYEIGDEKIILDANTYVEWFDIDDNMQVSLNEDKVREYVAGLAEKYDTYGKPKTFRTSYDSTITISQNVEYGWEVDQEAEVEAIKEEIASGETTTRDLHYSHKAESHTGNDYGNSYVEVSLTDQELFIYKKGSLLLECKVVTGCTNKGNGTPAGIWGIRYKQQDRVLKGEDYQTPVAYWMPFNGNIGLHDANWRGSFGGEIYIKHGSHGCVNMPSKSAEAAYDMVYKGMPVIVYEK